MAQTLREGCSYSLITEQDKNEKRQVYFVKLTDSCLKAIEEYTNEFKDGSQMKSIIKFDEAQNGVITIPSKCDIEKKFNFAISNVVTSENNPLQECIKQYNWNSDKLLSYGPLEQKISIAATDDCYENTRNRMAQVDQERKDIRTKEIKLGSMKKGKKSQNKVVAQDHKLTAIKNIRKINSHTVNSPKPSVISVTSSTNNHASPSLSKKSPIPSSRKSPTSSTNTNRKSPSLGGKSFTCRERVIHILALRAHKKPELISRLQREAMSQKDRSNLAMVLQQVASHSENQYTLLPHLYTELQVETWPFYSESEKSIVKGNIAISKKVDPTSPQLVSSTSKSPEEKSQKRLSVTNPDHNNKKQKTDASEEPSSTSISPKKCDEQTNLTTSNPVISNETKPQGEESPPTVASTSDSPEYLVTYKPITSREQRFLYKRDFQLEYPEYINLKNNLDAVATKFIELDSSLRKTTKGTAEYLRIQEEIMTAYNKQQQDEKYHRMKCRCEELHQKLSHIKRLVMDYDNQMVNS